MSFLCLTTDDGPHTFSPSNQEGEPSTASGSAGGRAADLAVRVEQALRDTHLPELACVEVEIRYGRMHLRGAVSSWYLKQSAQSAARRVDPSMLLINLIRVAAPTDRDGEAGPQSGQRSAASAPTQ